VLSGGTLGETYDLKNKVTTTGGSVTRTYTRTLRIAVQFRSNIDRVRLLVGDQDTTDQLLSDDEYVFALSEAGDNKYRAASILCHALAGKFARRVDTSFEGVSADYSQRQEHYTKLAIRYERQANRIGGLGSPKAGGVSIDAMDSAEDDSDRPDPSFKRNQFKNPPDTTYDDYWRQK
jgi:hypothetical protein